jgi:hypothetical protein
MKLIILCLNTANKPSPMSKGVMEIRINSQRCKGIKMTTWHTWAMETTWVASVHNAVKDSGRVLPCPSAVFHTYASTDTLWVAWTLSHCTSVKQGKVSSNPSTHEATKFGDSMLTHEATKFGDSISPICVSTFKCLFIRAQPTWAITDIGGDYHLRALNFRSHHTSSYPSIILPFPLSAPPSLQLCQYLDHLATPHRTSIDRKDPTASGFQPFDFYRCLYN